MKYLNKLAEIISLLAAVAGMVVMLVAVVVAYKIDCTKNDNGTYSCSTEAVK